MPKQLFVFTDMQVRATAPSTMAVMGVICDLLSLQFDAAAEVPNRGTGLAANRYGILPAGTAASTAASAPHAGPFGNASDDIKAAFAAAGYEVPLIVFWNLAARGAPSFQAESHIPGVALMSGFSQVRRAFVNGVSLFVLRFPVVAGVPAPVLRGRGPVLCRTCPCSRSGN